MESLLESASPGHPGLPGGNEMIRVLDYMEKLGEALAEAPDEKVGTFSNHFEELTGWNYSRGESRTTIQRFGYQRWFNDSKGRRFCQQRLTRRYREPSTQIYFDKDPEWAWLSPTWGRPVDSLPALTQSRRQRRKTVGPTLGPGSIPAPPCSAPQTGRNAVSATRAPAEEQRKQASPPRAHLLEAGNPANRNGNARNTPMHISIRKLGFEKI